MKRMIFELSMPSNNAWNNKWSGEKCAYSVARKVTEKSAKRLNDYYSYSFGDGWVACVTVREAKPRERASGKFCGYNWMIDEIIWYGEIRGAKKAIRAAGIGGEK